MELVDAAWTKFTVVSVARGSDEWTRHCTGLVKVEVSPPAAKDIIISSGMDTRFPSIQAWYDKFTDIGLGYGETFRSLSELQVDPHRTLAKATVVLDTTAGTIKGGESSYYLHPTALDATFQLAIIAMHGGHFEKATAAFVPVHLSQLYMKAGAKQDLATATAQGSIQGLRNAYARLQMMDSGGEILLEVDSMRFTSFRESSLTKERQSKQPFSSPFTRLVWKPDIRTLNNSQIRELFPPPIESADGAATLEVVDLICCLVAFEIYETFILGDEEVEPKGDLRHWLAWIKRTVEEDQRPNVVKVRELSATQRRQRLEESYNQVGDIPEAKAVKLLHENVGEILNERRMGIDVLVSEKLLTPLYETGYVIAGSHPQVSNIMDCLGHANPNLRILEVGAGTGAATRAAIKALAGPNGIKRYADYTFTGISAGFLASAKEMLLEYRDVNYTMLDIEQNALENGYEPVYDVVLACEAIHATASMQRTLAHCRSLLKPGGKLVLVESTRMRVLLCVLYGTLTGFWEPDDRTEGPFMNLQTWQKRLGENGFSGTDLVLDDYYAPHNTTSVIVSTRVEERDVEQSTSSAEQLVYLLHDGSDPRPLSEQVTAEFKSRGTTCKAFPLNNAVEAVPANARVIVFLSSKIDLFDANEFRLESFQHLAKNVKSMVWLIPGDIVGGQNPRGAFMTGLLRVIATEDPAGRFISINIEADSLGLGNADLICSIVNYEIAAQSEELGEGSIDSEFAWKDGAMRVSRVVTDAELAEYSETTKTLTRQGYEMQSINSQCRVRATFETAGIFSSLYFRPYTELLQPLPNDYIDVKVAAVGLNWKDIGLTTGRFTATSDNLSSEYAGVVTNVVANVVGLSVGDRIYGVGKGHFGNYTRVPAMFAQKLEHTDDFFEAATMPLVYMTAVYALNYLAQIRRGQKILIQSASGGLGLALIKLARSKGAEIFATVSTADKVSFLAGTVGIPIDRIFSLRDPESLPRAVRATGKGGFDVIIGTAVGGDSLHQSLKALAPMGHLVDVGRLDVLESKEIGLEIFQKNARFSSFDLNVVLDNDSALGLRLMKDVKELHKTGQITPIRPFTISDISELSQTLTSFSRGTHIGKLVVSFQNPNSIIKALQQPQTVIFDPDACYIITGGLGGLGRSIIGWMVDRGAQDFVILSRRTNTPVGQVLFDNLRARGVRIKVIACDVSKREQVVQVIRQSSATTRSRVPDACVA